MLRFGIIERCRAASLQLAVLGLSVSLLGLGCGGGSKPAAPATGETAAAPAKVASKSKESSRSTNESGASSKSTAGKNDSSGPRKSSRGIPYDAFFDDPLAEANNSTAVATAPAAKPDAPMAESTAKPAADSPKPAAGGSGTAWADFISAEVVQSETKKVRNHLSSAMQGPGAYNKECKEIGWDGALLAGLAGIASDHSEATNWKANAHFIRDFSSELSNAAAGPGKENYEKSKTAYEKLSAVFDGTIPADAGDVAPKRPFHETADRAGVMQRIQKASEWLRLNINTEAKMKSDLETIQHESMIVAALGKIIATEGYADTEEEDYQKYATDLIVGGKEAGAAAKDQNFKQFTDAINKIGKSCTECHPKYAQ